MSHAIFERALVTVSVGSGAHRVALSIYHLTDGTKWCWIDEHADLESLLWRLELSFRKTGGVPCSLGVRPSRPFTKPNSTDWSATFQRFCTHFGVRAVQTVCGRRNAVHTKVVEHLQSRTFENLQTCQQALHDDFPPGLTAEKLKPLPVTAFVSDKALFRRVAGDGFMLCRGDAYSVPDEYRGKTVWIQICGDQAIIRSKEGRLLAQHPAGSGKGDVFLHESHFERRQLRATLGLQRAFIARFPQFGLFLSGLLVQRAQEAASTLRVLLHLADRYTTSELTQAFDCALRYNNFSHRFIQGYLTRRPTPPSPNLTTTEQGLLFG